MIVAGSLQFWQRTCDASGHCPLPTAVGDRIPVSGSVEKPAAAGQIGEYSTAADADGLHLVFQVYWTAPPDGSKPYLVGQARVTKGTTPVTECTQYADDSVATYFPVGACSGFLPADGGGTSQIGITFYK